MDPNSGKVYRDITAEEAEARGLVPVSEHVADMLEVGAVAMAAADAAMQRRRDTQPKKTKAARRKRTATAKVSRRANRA
jgi:hypothetical protein